MGFSSGGSGHSVGHMEKRESGHGAGAAAVVAGHVTGGGGFGANFSPYLLSRIVRHRQTGDDEGGGLEAGTAVRTPRLEASAQERHIRGSRSTRSGR